MINFEIRIFNITFEFKINVDDNSPYGLAGKLVYFRIALSHCYRFWMYGIELSKWSSISNIWNTKIWLDCHYGDQHMLTQSKSKRFVLKDYKNGIFDD